MFPPTGGWSPNENITDPHVIEIAEFAVEEYKKKSNKDLKLERVIKGEKQVVAGMKYGLLLVAKKGVFRNAYKAVVWERPWLNFRELTSFKRVWWRIFN